MNSGRDQRARIGIRRRAAPGKARSRFGRAGRDVRARTRRAELVHLLEEVILDALIGNNWCCSESGLSWEVI